MIKESFILDQGLESSLEITCCIAINEKLLISLAIMNYSYFPVLSSSYLIL